MPLGSGSPQPSTRTVVLSEPVCDWLSSLREEDLELMMGAMRFFQALRIVGRVLKWLIVTWSVPPLTVTVPALTQVLVPSS